MQIVANATEKIEKLARELERAEIIIYLIGMLESGKSLEEVIEELKRK